MIHETEVSAVQGGLMRAPVTDELTQKFEHWYRLMRRKKGLTLNQYHKSYMNQIEAKYQWWYDNIFQVQQSMPITLEKPRFNKQSRTSQMLAHKMTPKFGTNKYMVLQAVRGAGDKGMIREQVDWLTDLQMCTTTAALNSLEKGGHIISLGTRKSKFGNPCKIYYYA